MLTTEERNQIAETLALHAYIADENQLDQLDEIFTPDAVYDMSASGIGVFDGADNIRAAAVQMNASGYAPTAHFVTNVIIAEDGPAAATAKSRGLMIMHDGTIHAVTYHDALRPHQGRWRISRRIITPLPVQPGEPASH